MINTSTVTSAMPSMTPFTTATMNSDTVNSDTDIQTTIITSIPSCVLVLGIFIGIILIPLIIRNNRWKVLYNVTNQDNR